MLKVLTMIDQANLHFQLKSIGRKANFSSLRDPIISRQGRYELDSYIYAPIPQVNGERVIRWHDHLRSLGYIVVSKRVKHMPNGAQKGNLDGELMLDAIELCSELKPDIFVLVSGDGDFTPLLQRVRRKGIKVEVAGIPENIANELKLVSNQLIDLTPWAMSRCDIYQERDEY